MALPTEPLSVRRPMAEDQDMHPFPPSPISPMLAKAVDAVPEQDSVPGGLSYEPKWDGFRAIVYFDGSAAAAPRC